MSRIGGFLAVLIMMTAFAGCSSDPETKAASSVDGDTNTAGGNSTSNVTLVPVIVVSIDGNITQPVNETINASVGMNLTFDGSDSTGENLTFAWDFGDNATGTNSSETHAYAAPGLFNVTLAITSGNTTVDASVVLNITSAGPAPGSLVMTVPHDFSGTLLVGDPNSDSAPIGGTNSIRTHPVPIIDTTEDGTTVVAKTARLTLSTSSQTALIVNLQWRDPSGAIKARGDSNYQGGEMNNDHTITFEEPMPAGDWGAFVRHMVGANAQYTLHIEIDYYSV